MSAGHWQIGDDGHAVYLTDDGDGVELEELYDPRTPGVLRRAAVTSLHALISGPAAESDEAASTVPAEVTAEEMAEALNVAWGEFVGDTGCYPDAIEREDKDRLTADFGRGNFADMAASWLNVRRRRLVRDSDAAAPGEG